MRDAKLQQYELIADGMGLKFRRLLTFIIILSVFSGTCSATYSLDNSITVKTSGILWEYTETYSGDRSVTVKGSIDTESGDDNGFISAWELLKHDVMTTRSFFNSIKNNMDIKIDNSSRNIYLLRVETDMSRELIGPVRDKKDIVNRYRVFYDFKKPLSSSDTTICLMGEPGTDVIINLPHEMLFVSVAGTDEETARKGPHGTHIRGMFGTEGEITLMFSIEEPQIAEKEENVTQTNPPASSKTSRPSLLENIFPGLSDSLLEKLSSKIFKVA
ncbi:MAG: hypothetical protein QCH31_01690 [Methanolobus sp.]|nr:hypothetical protein [Methanolobus sp.]